MSDAKHPFLPELKDEAGVAIPSAQGRWISESEPKQLSKVANGLAGADNVAQHDLSSIPDIWARALLFKSAFDPKNKLQHPLRAELEREWRGLLSLLALNKIHHEGDIRIVRVALADAETQAGSAFARALRLVAPEPVRLAQEGPSYGWDDVFLICYKPSETGTEVALGAFSPATLAYTGAGYSELFGAHRSKTFYPDGRLRQPAGNDERAYLAAWVKDLHGRIGGRLSQDGAHVVGGLLTSWLEELSGPAERRVSSVTADVDADTLDIERAQGILQYEIYKEVLRPLAGTGSRSDDNLSDILLQFNRKNRTSVDHVVVASAQTLGSDVRVWRATRSTNFDGNIAEPGTILDKYFPGTEGEGDRVGNQELKGAKWIRPEKFFLTDTLLIAPLGDLFLPDSEAPSNVDGHYVLPFKRSILDYFTPSEIVRDLRPQYKSIDEGVIFSFQLPIGKKGQEDRRIEVRKTFKRRNRGPGEGEIVETPPPALYIYPRDLGKCWRRYYLFQHGLEQVHAEPLFSDGRGRTLPFRERQGSNSRITEIAGDDLFPEAIELAKEKQGIQKGRGAAAGLVLLAPEKPLDFDPKPNPGEQLQVGIDFGTSNTTVYYRATDKGQDALTLHFHELLRPLCREQAGIDDVLRREFVPNENVQPPFSTTLRLPNLAATTASFLDYSIYFPRRDSDRPEFSLPDDVYGDVKWDEKAQYFLRFLLFVVLVEVARRRSEECALFFSFPKAFTRGESERFKGWCISVADSLLENPETRVFIDRADIREPSVHDGSADQRKPPVFPKLKFAIEAVAAGYHFAGVDPALNNRAVCLDVGGGTTDIALWFDGKIRLDASVRLAGRQISELVSQSASLRERLFHRAAAQSLDDRRDDLSRFATRLNLILRQEDAAVRKSLTDNSHRDEIKWLRKMLALEFGAIVYYCAALVANADANGDVAVRGRAMATILSEGIGFYWGGNAARLLNWLGLGHFNAGAYEDNFLRGVFKNGIHDAANEKSPPMAHLPQNRSSEDKLKFEVAAGLSLTPDHLLEKAPGGGAAATLAIDEDDLIVVGREESQGNSPTIILGEDCIVDGDEIGWTQSISEGRLFVTKEHRTLLDRSTGNKLGKFVEVFNALGLKFGLLDTDSERVVLGDVDKLRIGQLVRGRFVEQAHKEEKARVVEPVFILEIKELMKLLSDRFQSRR